MNLFIHTAHASRLEPDLKQCLTAHELEVQIDHEIQSSHYFLMILDVASQLDLLQLRHDYPQALMIFIGNEQAIFNLMPLRPFYYLREKELEADWQRCLETFQNYLDENFRMLDIKAGRSRIRLRIQSIVYIESYRHYLTIHTMVGTYTLRENISQLTEKLKNDGFIRCHKSYLVNKRFIMDRTLEELILQDRSRLPIGRAYQQALAVIDL